nr:hypothetical protein [Tanacetum cinerariifolium]
MVACLERIDGNDEFHQIVDFFTTSPIHYALTVSPTVYASYIKQFWAIAKSKTVNDVKKIHATVDGKTVVILELSVRSDLYFNDEDGITCLSNDEIFINLALMGFLQLFLNNQIDLAEPFNDVYVTPVHTKKVGDEAVYTGEDDRVVRASTATTCLEGTGSGSGPRCQDTTLGDAYAHTWDLALEQLKTAQDLVIKKLQKKVKILEKKKREITPGMNLFKIGTSKRQSLEKENVSKQGRNLKTRPMFEEGGIDDNKDDINDMVDEEMKNVKGNTVNTTGTVNTATPGVSVASASVSTAEQEQFTIEEKSRMLVEMIAKRKRLFAAQRAAEQRSKPPTKAQMRNRMCTYLKNQAGYKYNQLKGRSYDDIHKLFNKAYKQVNSFIPMDSEVVKDNGKKDDSSSKEAGRKEQVQHLNQSHQRS